MKNIFKALKNVNIETILLSIGFLLLFFHYAVFNIHVDIQMVILLVLVFIIGVPHGALDFLVDEQNHHVTKNSYSIKKFLIIYLSRLFIFSLFWLLPWLAFSLFIIFSIFHFGETDVASMVKTNKSSTILYCTYGSFILALLLLTHLNEIIISLPIMGEYIKDNVVFIFINKYAYYLLFAIAVGFLSVFIWQIKKGNIIKIQAYKIAQFTCLLIIVAFLPMLLAFTFYFALWHSILSVRNIFSYFKKYNTGTKFTVICYKSILFSLLALGSIVGLYFIMSYYMPNMNLLFALLIVLSVLTLPHLKVMHNMYSNNNLVA